MHSRQSTLRFFRHEDLEPCTTNEPQHVTPFLTSEEIRQLETFCEEYLKSGRKVLRPPVGSFPPHLRMFIAILAGLGAVQVSTQQDTVVVEHAGRLSKHVPQILSIYVKRGYALINDWGRSAVMREDQLNAVEFVHQLELRRILLDRESGIFPEPLAERPVAFGIFRAIDTQGKSSYLFEVNKDWQKLNFIGGKQEPEDNGDYSATVKREISEELGISPTRLTLTRLNDHPIVGYSLSGNVGSLARYPCVLFGVSVDGNFGIRPQDQWIDEETIRAYTESDDSPIMVNPSYLSFLLEGNPSRLERCPITTSEIVKTIKTEQIETRNQDKKLNKLLKMMRENKELLAAVLTLAAALITIILAF
jgi:8-oxo-dGTP pyrophosphatase MutT (NUDIX family)